MTTSYIDISTYYKPSIFARLGDFWTKHFPESEFTRAVVNALEDEANQVCIRLHEDLALLTNIEKAPLWHTELWHALLLLESEMTLEDPRSAFYGERPVAYGSDQQWTYGKGFPDVPALFCWPKPEALMHPGCIMNSPTQASYLGFINQDYWINKHVIGFRINPFADPRFKPFDTEQGRAVIIWLRMSRWDLRDFANIYAAPLGVPHAPSTESYRDVCVGVWKARTAGQSASAVYRVIAGLTGIPLCRSDREIVEAITSNARYRFVITNAHVYRFPLSHTVAVSVGQILREGQSLTHQMYVKRAMDIKSGEEPITLPPQFFNAQIPLQKSIRFPNARVPVHYTHVISAAEKSIAFRIDGRPEDIKAYRRWLKKARAYRLFDKRGPHVSTEPQNAHIVPDVNPALLVRMMTRANLLIVYGDKHTWNIHHDLMRMSSTILNYVVPPHGAVIFHDDVSSAGSLSFSSVSFTSESPSESQSFSSWSSRSTESSSRSSASHVSSLSSETSSSSWWSRSDQSLSSRSSESTSESSLSLYSKSSLSSTSESSYISTSQSSQSRSSLSSKSSASTQSSATSPSSPSSLSSRSSETSSSSSTLIRFSTSSESSYSSQSFSSKSSQSFSSQSLFSESSQSLSSESSQSPSSQSLSSESSQSPSSQSESSQSSVSTSSASSLSSIYSGGYVAYGTICGYPVPPVYAVSNYKTQPLSTLLDPSYAAYDRFMNRAFYIKNDVRLWYIRSISITAPYKMLGINFDYTIYPYIPTSVLRVLCANNSINVEFPEYLVVIAPHKTTYVCTPEPISDFNPCSPDTLAFVKRLQPSDFSINSVNTNGTPTVNLVHNNVTLNLSAIKSFTPSIYDIPLVYVAFVSKHTNAELDHADYITYFSKPQCHLAHRLNNYIFTQYHPYGFPVNLADSTSSASFSSESTSSESPNKIQFVPTLPKYAGAFFGFDTSNNLVYPRQSSPYVIRNSVLQPNGSYNIQYYLCFHFYKLSVTANTKYIFTIYDATSISTSSNYDQFKFFIWNSTVNPIISEVANINILDNALLIHPASATEYILTPTVKRVVFTALKTETIYVGLVYTINSFSTESAALTAYYYNYQNSSAQAKHSNYGLITYNLYNEDINRNCL